MELSDYLQQRDVYINAGALFDVVEHNTEAVLASAFNKQSFKTGQEAFGHPNALTLREVVLCINLLSQCQHLFNASDITVSYNAEVVPTPDAAYDTPYLHYIVYFSFVGFDKDIASEYGFGDELVLSVSPVAQCLYQWKISIVLSFQKLVADSFLRI